jgi:hypothetical protein
MGFGPNNPANDTPIAGPIHGQVNGFFERVRAAHTARVRHRVGGENVVTTKQRPANADTQTPVAHELVQLFASGDVALSGTLVEMLDEHYTHQTERRGCGFTQATRVLAGHINRPPSPVPWDDSCWELLADWDWPSVQPAVEVFWTPGERTAWSAIEAALASSRVEALNAGIEPDTLRRFGHRLRRLRALPGQPEREESRLLARLIKDTLFRDAVEQSDESTTILPPWPERLEIGTCPLAEKYFLELAYGRIQRHASMNVIVDGTNRPILVEKIGMGSDHSCVSVAPLWLNGVRLPPGSLVGVHYDAADVEQRPNGRLPGFRIPADQCRGFRFLRLTTLSVSPAHRRRAFTTHFEAQVQGGLFAPEKTTVHQLEQVAAEQLAQ